MNQEHVVLVSEQDEVLGTMEKLSAHSGNTPLHRAFSLFIFNSRGELLLQQRALTKKTWPGVWSNSCCGHPQLNETRIDAVKRRTKEEIGIELNEVKMVSPYRYTYIRDGIMENEICPIHVAFTDAQPIINPSEVAAIKWVKWSDFLNEIKNNPGKYSEWCEEEARIIDSLGIIKNNE